MVLHEMSCFLFFVPTRDSILFYYILQSRATVSFYLRSCKMEVGMYTGIPITPQAFSNMLITQYIECLFFLSSRSSRSPLKLITRFPEHPDIATLHDNFQSVSSTFLVVSKMNSYITKWKCLKSPSSIAITNMRI